MKKSDKQLLVEAALAAANHRLEKQALCIVEAFPYLIDDDEDRCICISLIYFALDKRSKAIRTLNGLSSPELKGYDFFTRHLQMVQIPNNMFIDYWRS